MLKRSENEIFVSKNLEFLENYDILQILFPPYSLNLLVLLSLIHTNTFAIKLRCSFKISRWISEIPAFYECESTTSVINTQDEANVTAVIGSHLEGKSNDDVISVYIYVNS